MTLRTDDLPNAGDVGVTVIRLRHETPQWQVYNAMRSGQAIDAWRFWPACLRQDQIGRATWAHLPATALCKLDPQAGIWPQIAAYSASSASGWLLFPHTQRAMPAALAKPANWPQIIRELAGSLDLRHRAGLLHLDVHPDNLYDDGGTIRLLGAGIDVRAQAHFASGPEHSNRDLARRHYGAPEQWDLSGKAQLGPWTDIFGAAATLVTCLTGNPPADFRERLGNPRWRAELAGALKKPLDSLGKDAAGVERLILTGLEPRVAARPRSVADWLQGCALDWATSAKPAAAKPAAAKPKLPPTAAAKSAPEEEVAEGRGGMGWWLALVAGLLAMAWWLLTPHGAEEAAIGDSGPAEVEAATPDPALPADLPSSDPAADAAAKAAAQAAAAAESAAAQEQVFEPAFDPDQPVAEPYARSTPTQRYTSAPSPAPSAAPPPPRQQTVRLPATEQVVTQSPSWRSGAIGVADFPVPAGGRQVRYGTFVQVEFTVTPNGMATNCRVTRPGPDAPTNARMCDLVVSRLRFNAARDQNGNPVAAQYGWKQEFYAPR